MVERRDNNAVPRLLCWAFLLWLDLVLHNDGQTNQIDSGQWSVLSGSQASAESHIHETGLDLDRRETSQDWDLFRTSMKNLSIAASYSLSSAQDSSFYIFPSY